MSWGRAAVWTAAQGKSERKGENFVACEVWNAKELVAKELSVENKIKKWVDLCSA